MYDTHSEDFKLVHKIAFMFAEAEIALGIYEQNKHLPLQAKLDSLLQCAMENPTAVDEGTYKIAYIFAQQLHQPKQELTTQ